MITDFTALTIFEQFKKEPSTTAVERVLKKLAESKAKEILAVSDPGPNSSQLLSQRRLGDPTVSPATPSSLRTSAPSDLVSLPLKFCLPKEIHTVRLGPLPELPENPTSGDERLLDSLRALQAHDYIHALTLVNEAIAQGISWDLGKAEAFNLRGTFK